MNPPFSASPGVDRTRHDADLRHIRSAFSMLPPGGRLVAISSSHCTPGDPAWADAFASLDPPARTVFTAPIDGRAYARRGTTFDTRLTVLDRGGEQQGQVYAGARVRDAAQLLQVVTATAERPSSMSASMARISEGHFIEVSRWPKKRCLAPSKADSAADFAFLLRVESTTCRTVTSHSAAPRIFDISVGAFVGTSSNR